MIDIKVGVTNVMSGK